MAHLLHLFRRFDAPTNRVHFNEARRDIINDKKDAIREIREKTRDRLAGLKGDIQRELQEFKDQSNIEYKVQRDDVKRKDLVEWIVRDALGQIRGEKARDFARQFIRRNLKPYEIKALAEGDTLKIVRGRLSIVRSGKEIYAQDMMNWTDQGVVTQGVREAEARAQTTAQTAPREQITPIEQATTPVRQTAPAPTVEPTPTVRQTVAATVPEPSLAMPEPTPVSAETAPKIPEAVRTLNGNERFNLPESISHWKGGDFDRNLKDMAYGEQILKDLQVLAQLEGKNHGAIDVWQEMRKINLNATNISVNEISRAVFGKPLDTIMNEMIDPRTSKERRETLKKFVATTKDLVRVFRAQDALEQHDALNERTPSGLKLSPEAKPVWEKLNALFNANDTGPNRRFHSDQEIGMNYVKGRADRALASEAAVNRYLQNLLFKVESDGTIQLRPTNEFKDKLAQLLVEGSIIASKGKTNFNEGQAKGMVSANEHDLPWLLQSHAEDLTAGVAAEFKSEMRKLDQQLLAKSPMANKLRALGVNDEDLPAAEAAIREKLQLYAGQLVNMTDVNEPWLEAWDAGVAIPIKGSPVNVKLGISGAGIMISSPANEPVVLSWGANAGYGGLSTGVDLTAKMAEFRDGGAFTFNTGAGVGIKINDPEGARFFGALIYATLGYSRDLGKVLEGRTNETYNEVEQDVKKALATVPNANAEAIMETLKSEIGYDQLQKMSALQFLGFKVGASVNTTRGPLAVMPVIALKFAILGKTYTVYQAEQPGVSASDLANAEFTADINAEGKKLFASNIVDQLADGTEATYENGGVILERIGDTQEYKLKMPAAQGRINVYLDSKSGIAGKVDANGDIVFTLDSSDKNITVRHATARSTFGDSGFVENHDVFVTANATGETPADNGTVWNRTGDKFVFYSLGMEKTHAAVVKTHLSEETRSDTAERAEDKALIDARLAYEAAAQRLAEYNEQRTTQEVGADRKSAIESIVKKYLENKTDRIDYKNLTVENNQTAINTEIAQIIGSNNEQEVAYARQKLMEQTLHDIKESEVKQHVESWNSKRLANILGDADTQQSSDVIKQILQSTSNHDIQPGSKVLIEVGTEKINGYRTAEWQEVGAQLTHATDLTSLDPEIRAKLAEHLVPKTFEAKMQTPLGQEVVKAMGVTSPELSASLVSENPSPEAKTNFETIYEALSYPGVSEFKDTKGNTFTLPENYKETLIGFYDKCMNLALVAPPVKLDITIPEAENPTRTITFKTAEVNTALRAEGRRDAVGLTNVTAVRLPKPSPTTTGTVTPKPEDGKVPTGEQETIEGGDRGTADPREPGTGGTETPGEGGGTIPV